MEKNKVPSSDNFRIFRISLNEKYRFYVFIIALFGLPIGLFKTSGYWVVLNNIIEYLLSGFPSEMVYLLSYLFTILIVVLIQLGITLVCLYVLIKIRGYQKRIIPSEEKQKIWTFHPDDEKRLILLATSLFGIVMYSFYFMQWVNTLYYNIQCLVLDSPFTTASILQIIFNLITISMVLSFSIYTLIRLKRFQITEENSPRMVSFTYHEKYIKLIFIIALIGIFAAIFVYILENVAYIPLYMSYIIRYDGYGPPYYLILYYSNFVRQFSIEIGRGIIIFILSILTIKNVYTYQKQIRV